MPKLINYAKLFAMYLRQDVPEKHSGEYLLDCPFGTDVGGECENPTQHFFANCDTGQWHCKRCDQSGNALTLLTNLHKLYLDQTTANQWEFLSKLRNISATTLETAQFAYDAENDRWLVPYFTYDPDRQDFSPYLNNLGLFYPSMTDGPFTIRKASALPLYLYNPGLHYHPPLTTKAIICEGEWDTLAYYDLYPDTGDLVVSKPGAGFNVNFLKSLNDCNSISLLLDNDQSGRKQTAGAIQTIQSHAPKFKLFQLDWSLIPDAPKDIRDMLIQRPDTAAEDISLATIPYTEGDQAATSSDEIPERLTAGYVRDASIFDTIPSFQKYVDQMQDMLYLGNEETLLAMAATLAITTSISIAGEPLWGFLIGPPASGKTTFIESFGGSNQWFDNLSKITAESFVSGWRDETGEEPSYLPTLQNKTLFVKDFTTTLTGPPDAQKKVFGLLTDIYDGHVKIHYGNNQMREFHDTYFNMVAGVTDIVHSHSAASIGERFLRIDWLGANYDARAYARVALSNFGKSNAHKAGMTALTLGFVKHLREQSTNISIEPQYFDPILDLAEFISIVRTKVESDRYEGIIYKPRSELPTRLAKQLGKLFVGAKTVVGSPERAFKVVRKVALDTCYGFSLDIVKYILKHPKASREEIAVDTKIHSQRAWRVLNDLCTTGVLKIIKGTTSRKNGRPPLYYSINPKLLPALEPDKYLMEPLNANRQTDQRQRPDHNDRPLRPRKPRPAR